MMNNYLTNNMVHRGHQSTLHNMNQPSHYHCQRSDLQWLINLHQQMQKHSNNFWVKQHQGQELLQHDLYNTPVLRAQWQLHLLQTTPDQYYQCLPDPDQMNLQDIPNSSVQTQQQKLQQQLTRQKHKNHLNRPYYKRCIVKWRPWRTSSCHKTTAPHHTRQRRIWPRKLQKGMNKEMGQMKKHDVYAEVSTDTVDQETLHNAIDSRWVHKSKTPTEVRSRIVAKGYKRGSGGLGRHLREHTTLCNPTCPTYSSNGKILEDTSRRRVYRISTCTSGKQHVHI